LNKHSVYTATIYTEGAQFFFGVSCRFTKGHKSAPQPSRTARPGPQSPGNGAQIEPLSKKETAVKKRQPVIVVMVQTDTPLTALRSIKFGTPLSLTAPAGARR
jgi:hypothetical protein